MDIVFAYVLVSDLLWCPASMILSCWLVTISWQRNLHTWVVVVDLNAMLGIQGTSCLPYYPRPPYQAISKVVSKRSANTETGLKPVMSGELPSWILVHRYFPWSYPCWFPLPDGCSSNSKVHSKWRQATTRIKMQIRSPWLLKAGSLFALYRLRHEVLGHRFDKITDAHLTSHSVMVLTALESAHFASSFGRHQLEWIDETLINLDEVYNQVRA